MGNDEILTDDYLAGVLAKEAKDCSLKYSTIGMDAYKSTTKYELRPFNALALSHR